MEDQSFTSGKACFHKRIAHVCYHLVRDNFPYSAPNFTGLLNHIRYLAEIGYNAICLEAEAMLPFRSAPEIASGLTWTHDQVAQLVDLLKELNMEVIPLLQCLGHNYFILSHPAYASLRELPGAFQQYCPTNPETRKQYLRMIDDILELFPEVKRIHIGGDECRMLGECLRCKSYIEKHSVSGLYCQHVTKIVNALSERDITPMLWSDMFESHPETLKEFPNTVQIVYWNYSMANWPRPFALDLFTQNGFHVIGASGIRFGQSTSAVSPPYPEALKGIADLTLVLNKYNVSEHMITDWSTKGTYWKMSDWAWFYASAKSFNPEMDDNDISLEYAKQRFGLSGKGSEITKVYLLLSVFLPFFEPLQVFLRDRLNRFDLIGNSYQKQKEKYRQADKFDEAMDQIGITRKNALAALDILWNLKPELTRGHDQWAILEDAARELMTRSNAAEMALLDPDSISSDKESLTVVSKLEGLRLSLKAREKRAFELYSKNTSSETVTQLLKFRYPEDEQKYLSSLSKAFANRCCVKNQKDSVIPFLYNPGPPYERGLEHGRVFASQIRKGVENFCQDKNNYKLTPARDIMEKYLFDKFPWMIDEMKGIAQGAGISLETIIWLNVFNAAVAFTPENQNCSTAIYRKDGEIALMKTSDIDYQQREMMILQMLDWNGMKILNCGWAGTVWTEFGVNAAGLAVGCNSAPPPFKESGYGLAQHLGCYPLLAECKNVRAAIAFMEKYPFAGKGLNVGCADAGGNRVTFERPGPMLHIHKTQTDVLVITNHYTSDELKDLNQQRTPEKLKETVSRKARIEEFLKSSEEPVCEALRSCAAITEGEGHVCRRKNSFGGTTLAGAVINPRERSMYITGAPPCEGKWAFFDLTKKG